jgi:hypothetical protein
MRLLRWWKRTLRRLSGWHLFAFTVVMFGIGAAPVFAAFFATNGVRASSVVAVIVTALLMIGIAGGMAAAGDALKRRLLGSDEEP